MSARRKTTVGVIFGGRSVEHDVSVVTGHQVMRAFDSERYEIVPIYITRDGKWVTGDPLMELKNFRNEIISLANVQPVVLSPSTQHHGLIVNPAAGGLFARPVIKRLDVVFPTIHGSHGEDGTLQGLLELADIPYVGCGVMASAIANDKVMTKTVLKAAGIPVVESIPFTRHEWEAAPDMLLAQIRERLTFPVFVKPVTLGSSIGINRVTQDDNLLHAAIDVAANLDSRIMVESAVVHAVEINASVIGDDRGYQVSVLEQPLSWESFLTYEEKYLSGGDGMKSAQRIIPAPISDGLTHTIRALAERTFRVIDGRGIARIDFLVQPETDTVYVNEINTMPGSLAFYLWTETGLSPRELVQKLVEWAQDAHAQKRRNTYDYQTNLIALTAARGLKGTKGAKRAR
ncbi:MAG: D-alanine--D-alanine ligase family protein [bacterium]|nr:D-alanine--D-alanine ligase family protein [bacterium]